MVFGTEKFYLHPVKTFKIESNAKEKKVTAQYKWLFCRHLVAFVVNCTVHSNINIDM